MKPLLLGLCLFSLTTSALAQSQSQNPNLFAPFAKAPIAANAQKVPWEQLFQNRSVALLSFRQPLNGKDQALAVAWGDKSVLLSFEGAFQLKPISEVKALYSGQALLLEGTKSALQIDNAVQVVPITSLGEEAEVVAYYTLRNNGKTPLDLSVTSTSCGCTSAKLEKNRLDAGQSTKLIATMRADTERLVNITLTTSDSAQPRAFVALQSKQTFAPFQMPAPLSLFGEKGQSISTTTNFMLPLGWKISRVVATPEWLQTKIQSSAITSSTSDKGAPALTYFSLSATAPESAPEGTIKGRLRLELAGSSLQFLSIPVSGFLNNDIAASPRMVVLGDIAGGTARRTVVVRGPKPFSIRAIRGDVPELKVSADPKVVAKAHAVELLIPVEGTVGESFSRLATLELSDGRELSIDITGTVAAGRLPALAQNLAINQSAPTFEVADSSNKKISLASFAGKRNVLLTFFPHCFTGGCESHLTSLQRVASTLTESNTQIIAVSTDSTSKIEKFADDLKLSFPILSDASRQISLSYGAVQTATEAPSRMSVLIDKTGVVRFIDTDVHVQTHGADMLAKINELGLN